MALTLSASCSVTSQKRPVSSLFAGRVLKKPRCGPELQEAALRLLQQNQSLEDLLIEVSSSNPETPGCSAQSPLIPPAVGASLLVSELKREAELRDVSLTALTGTVLLQRLKELTADVTDELLPAANRAQLCVLLESSRELLSQGVLCPKLLWKELSRDEKFPKLEVAFHLHSYNVVSLQFILESHGVTRWLESELKSLCSLTPREAEAEHEQHRILMLVLQVLIGSGFDPGLEDLPQNKRLSRLCCSLLDNMLFWILDSVDQDASSSPELKGPQTWMELFDSSLCGTLVSPEALQRFFTHCLTKTITFRPRLTVSSAITLQNEWTFAKTNPLLTNLFCQLSVIFRMKQLFDNLRQILSTHEVNWRHVLSFISTLLVYNPSAQTSLSELLNILLTSAFQSYDLESVITAFLLARQGGLEGSAVFPSYTEWFKKCFGGSSSPHAASKKALVFLLKFLSDLVPFETPLYLKVHVLHPPFVPLKHRSLLLEYVSLAKTRLSDLKESLEDMGLYEDVSSAPTEQPQCQEAQDVEKAVSLFESTGRISATVMEASIFRRPYFLTRFLPALLAPRALPVRADARMKFIEALKKADKIPAAQFSSYVASCQKETQIDTAVTDADESPVDVLRLQLQTFRDLVLRGDERELLAQVSRMSHTLSVLCPPDSNPTTVIQLRTDGAGSDSQLQVSSLILKSFCQFVLDTSREEAATKATSWASRIVTSLIENKQVFSSLLQRLWDLLHNQASSLAAAHVLGLSVLSVQLLWCCGPRPLLQLPASPGPVSLAQALCSALRCHTDKQMLFCVRFCVVAVSYSLQRGDKDLDQIIPNTLYKKLLYLIPRLLPGARAILHNASEGVSVTWKTAADNDKSWTKSALSLWTNPSFQSLQIQPQYQLSFSEWLHNELRVCRGEDALSDPERQQYQQWACWELFLSRSEQDGGCGGDLASLCCHLLSAVLDHDSEESKGENKRAESCLPDVLSRLQECVYEMFLAERSGATSHKASIGSTLFKLLSQRLSPPSASSALSSELVLQHTIPAWNRVMLALPAELFIRVSQEGAGGSRVDCSLLIEHINQHQRAVCSAANLLSCHTTTHFLKGVLSASARCESPSEEFNTAWSQICQLCPLLLVSAAFWWEHLCVVLQSQWRRSCDEGPLPDQLILLSDSHHWALRVVSGQTAPTPSAPSLLLAACLHRAAQDSERINHNYISALRRDQKHSEVLVFLLSLSVNRYLSSLLHPKEKSAGGVETCSALLLELVDFADWLSIFKSNDRRVYHNLTMMTSAEQNRLMPWAFYSLMCQQSSEFLHKASRCPGFIHTSVLCYAALLQLFIDGHTPTQSSNQLEPSQMVIQSKKLLLGCISQMSGAALSSSQSKQLQDLCAQLDPEIAAALSHHQNLSLSPEMDFL